MSDLYRPPPTKICACDPPDGKQSVALWKCPVCGSWWHYKERDGGYHDYFWGWGRIWGWRARRKLRKWGIE